MLKTTNTVCTGSIGYHIESLGVSIVLLSVYITFSYLVEPTSANDLVKSPKLMHSYDNSAYFLETCSDNSDRNNRYNNKLAGSISLNDSVHRNKNLINNPIANFFFIENIYYIYSPLRSPPSA